MHNLCILFPMGISAIPRETEDTNYAKCFSFLGGWGRWAKKVYHGRCANGEWLLCSNSSTAAVSYSKGASTSKGILKTWNTFKDKKKECKMLTKRD